MKLAHIFIHGFVQGVGYRQFVKKHATELGLVGWVRNIPDGSVETVVQGPKEKIQELLTLCKKGPFLSEIEDIIVEYQEKIEDFSSFEIRH